MGLSVSKLRESRRPLSTFRTSLPSLYTSDDRVFPLLPSLYDLLRGNEADQRN